MTTTAEVVHGSLSDIAETLIALMDSADTAEPEQREALEREVQRYLESAIRKVDNIAEVLTALEQRADNAGAEIERLHERKSVAENAARRLKQYVVSVMEAHGLRKLEGRLNTLSLRASESVEIRDEQAVPVAYKRIVQTVSADKRAIHDAIKAGESVPGAALVSRNSLVRR